MSTSALFPYDFRTARPARLLYCHQEFLDKLEARRNEPAGKRAALLMQRMAVDITRLQYKGTSGPNRGWRRSRLGGRSGSHFYAWWAPTGSAALHGMPAFGEQHEAVFLRDIRHHDDHSPLSPGDGANDYLPMGVLDLRGGEYAPQPWTQPQIRFARSRGRARILKGHPGSGKTTALLHAADESQAERVLYLTFSRDLASLAREYFDRFCSDSRTFVVQTFPEFLELLAGPNAGAATVEEARAQFRRDLANQQRSLGPWANNIDALHDEMHAHLIGAALPEKLGRFAAAERLRLPDAAYRAQRARYLSQAAEIVLDTARRLERAGDTPLADRYFPDLAAAWRAAHAISAKSARFDPSWANFGCIAVDEVQDLTPLEAYVVILLSRQTSANIGAPPLLLAGDEAQTVRATDFEWAWLNDMLHDSLGAPQEFKLSVNLRSPRRIADLVNRAWELYDYLHKQDRPSGTGYAEIEDDSPDQVQYAAAPATDVPALIADLSAREGLAVIALDRTGIPAGASSLVLTPAEAKGLDFHSVCVLNGGALLRRISDPKSQGAADSLTRRLAIDQLRVALSRPTERLIWVDVAPDPETVQEVSELLRARGERALAPMSLEALRTSLAEEELDAEERIQRCQKDARQFIDVKPDLAWSRAQQAVAMLGVPGDAIAVSDDAVREAAHLTMAEVCFQLAFRGKKLSPELGRPNLYREASDEARQALKYGLSNTLMSIGVLERSHGSEERLNAIAALVQAVSHAKDELPAWLLVEIAPRVDTWAGELERHIDAGDNAIAAHQILPPFFDALRLPDAEPRKERLAQRCLRALVKSRRYVQALQILETLPRTDANRKLAAECYEESQQFEKAAALYGEFGDQEKALRCFRAAPDFDAAVKIVRQMERHPAKESLEWLSELNVVLGRRPDNFNRVMTTPEKKVLEAMLERGLGVNRTKRAAGVAVKKTAVKKTAVRKAAVKKAAKRGPIKRE